jgi:polyphosphate kinase
VESAEDRAAGDRGRPASAAPALEVQREPKTPEPVATAEEADIDPKDLKAPYLYLNRELSFLAFNRRVLKLAEDPEVPLLDRLFFLTVFSTNLDEFFEIRVAGLKQQVVSGLGPTGPDGMTATEQLSRIGQICQELVAEQYRILNENMLPSLERAGVRVLRRTVWTQRQQAWIKRFFNDQVLPVLTPMGQDPGHPFPKVLNKGLAFIVSLEGTDAFGRTSGIAILPVPRALPRLIALPPSLARGPNDYVMLSSVIHANVDRLFPGMLVKGCYQFRVTRNSDMWVEEEEVDDLLFAIQGELSSRKYGAAVRLELADNCPKAVYRFLLKQYRLDPEDVYEVNGPVNLHRLQAIWSIVDRPDLKYSPMVAGTPVDLGRDADVFAVMRRGDVLLHHPYQSFAPLLDLLRQAARDPDVLAIKQTLYRTGTESLVVEALIEAARAGKEVTVVAELRARFDEAANIDLATRLQEAGANVVYGIVGYKTHAKLLLIVRRERGKLKRYVHVGTGNYHSGTARAYTDFSLLTCDKHMGRDVHEVFMQLTSLGRATELKRLVQSPFDLCDTLVNLIDAEAEAARRGEEASIVARMNSLSEKRLIRALYRASRAGVQIELIVRGICCLRPGIPGVSENIRVRSVLGRFLEHSRVFQFHSGGEKITFMSSADWMPRNMRRRVEVAARIEDPALRDRLAEEALELYLNDTKQSWSLQADGSWVSLRPEGDKSKGVQEKLIKRLAD